MQKELLSEYVVLEAKFKALEDEKRALREKILVNLKENDLTKVDSEYGSFTVCTKTSWKYSEKVKTLEEKVKIAKDKEQKKGIAESSTSEYLLFKENKNDDAY